MSNVATNVRAAESRCRIAVSDLRGFYLHAFGYFEHRTKELEREIAKTPPKNSEDESFVGDTFAELKLGKTQSGYLCVLMMFSALERFLQDIHDLTMFLGTTAELRNVTLYSGQKRLSLDYFKSFFKRLGIDLCTAPYDWASVVRLQQYRNAIAHQGGMVTESNYRVLSPYGHALGEQIEISLEYVTGTGRLIDQTVTRFSNNYLVELQKRNLY